MIGKLAIIAALALATPAAHAQDAAAVKTRVEALRARVELLKDHDSIENLQAAQKHAITTRPKSAAFPTWRKRSDVRV